MHGRVNGLHLSIYDGSTPFNATTACATETTSHGSLPGVWGPARPRQGGGGQCGPHFPHFPHFFPAFSRQVP